MFLIATILVLTILACNINLVQSPEQPNLELTVTAQALLIQQGGQPAAPQSDQPAADSPAASPTVTAPGDAPAQNPAPGLTTTPTNITVTVSAETNCRKGPNVNFASVYSLPVNQVAEVVGKNTSTNYWIIKIPGSGSTCWLWGKYATVSGNTDSLTEFATPIPQSTATATKTSTPTSTVTTAPVLTAPAAVSNLSEQHSCTNSSPTQHNLTGTITWNDNSNNENGFNIYSSATFISGQQPDVLISSVGPNSTSYAFNIVTLSGVSVVLRVESFNGTGTSTRIPINIAYNCP
jgi:hypothetical protein